jgi:hypothetical protein
MTPQQLIGLGIRLCSLWVAFGAIRYLIALPMSPWSDQMAGVASLSYGFGALYVMVAALLWFFPLRIAHWLLPRTSFENKLDIRALEAARVGACLIGLWLFAGAAPSMVWYLFTAMAADGERSMFGMLDTEGRINLAVTCFELLFSAWLIARSRDFAHLAIRGARSARREARTDIRAESGQ